jgi:hypothetical protein
VACHDLAYTSTREGKADRLIRRGDTIHRKLGGCEPGGPLDPRRKPKGMHGRTYARLVGELQACAMAAMLERSAAFEEAEERC